MNPKASSLSTTQKPPTLQSLFKEYTTVAAGINQSTPLTDSELLLLRDTGAFAEWARIQREATRCLRDTRIALLSINLDEAQKHLEKLQEYLAQLKTLRNKGSDKLNSMKTIHEHQ